MFLERSDPIAAQARVKCQQIDRPLAPHTSLQSECYYRRILKSTNELRILSEMNKVEIWHGSRR